MTDLTASVAALFAGPVERFVPERDALVKRLRTAGDEDAANEVKALRKPTAAAAALNQLADDPVIQQLCDLGERLRDAQQRVDAPAMRDLSGERSARINRLLDRLGQPTGSLREQIVATATAALADPAAGVALQSGRLTKALSYSGFGEVDLSDAVARWSAAAPPARTDKKPAPKADRRAAVELAELQRAVTTAEEDLQTAADKLAAAQQRHATAEAALDTARGRLRDAGG